MELFAEILLKALENGKIEVTFPDLRLDPKELVEMRCYAALQKIKSILEDDSLDDRSASTGSRRSLAPWSSWGPAGEPGTTSAE